MNDPQKNVLAAMAKQLRSQADVLERMALEAPAPPLPTTVLGVLEQALPSVGASLTATWHEIMASVPHAMPGKRGGSKLNSPGVRAKFSVKQNGYVASHDGKHGVIVYTVTRIA